MLFYFRDLLELICQKLFGGQKGITQIELFYDDESAESETALVPTEKMGNLKFKNLICKIKTEKKVVSDVDSSAVPTSSRSNNATQLKKLKKQRTPLKLTVFDEQNVPQV